MSVQVEAGGDDFGATDFEIEFVDAAGSRCRGSLAQSWAVAFEEAPPIRGFGWSRGQKHFPGWWWSATTDRHVGFESWVERDHAMRLDFDRDVVAFSSQPFWLYWQVGTRWRRHAPDFFARLIDGGGVVVDVRPDDRIPNKDAQAFAVTARACDGVGWAFRRLGVMDPVFAANLRWLSRYRHPRHGARTDIVDQLVQAFASPTPLMAGAARVGDSVVVLPALFHLLWQQILAADLDAAVLAGSSIVRTASWSRP
ncbi:TnsA-like heteromeric transposase endonuclease subunit [Actinoplanes sp. NPDC051494]|uniref:TnsA-like heteromeric transposase endonuclease subunit n=1 Tax=Actinoplanes sp. NPDC051494 TaxID=3363907 RepID=UPI00379BE859